MKIAIQADGGVDMRTLVLADELSKENEVFYIGRVENRIEDGYEIISFDHLIECNISNSKYVQGIKNTFAEISSEIA
jgi:spore coat polysaccharide biosynthesis predicted glycosyltransferase SpsG